jgi:hypothetical protein
MAARKASVFLYLTLSRNVSMKIAKNVTELIGNTPLARASARMEGIGIRISSGAALWAAIQVA